jgi:hypothetical protein
VFGGSFLVVATVVFFGALGGKPRDPVVAVEKA